MIGISALRKRVADEDDPAGQPLRPRGRDVVAAQHLEHARPRIAHEQRRVREPEDHRRHHDVGSPVDDVVLLAEREQLADRQDLERDPEQVERDEPEHERRRADQEDREPRQGVVDPAVLVDRRDHAERHADEERDDAAATTISVSDGPRPGRDLLGDRAPAHDRVAEVALEDVAQPADVADRDRAGRGPSSRRRSSMSAGVSRESTSGSRRASTGSPGAADRTKKAAIVIPIRTGMAMSTRRMKVGAHDTPR